MRIVKNLKIYFSLDFKTMLLFTEAFLYLGLGYIYKSLPFSKVASYLGTHMDETPFTDNPVNKIVLRDISEVINIMSRHTLWESKCLVKAIAGMKMLERREIESTLYLGTAKDENGNMIAHAWLRSGNFYISGADVMEGFTIVSKFAKKI